MRYSFFLFIICILASQLSHAQPDFFSASAKKSKIVKQAERYFNQPVPVYQKSLDLLLKAQKVNPEDADINYMLGICYLNTIKKTKALDYFEKAYRSEEHVSPEILYLLGITCQLNYRFDLALDYYNQYQKSLTDEELQSKKVDRHLVNQFTRIRTMPTSRRYTINHIDSILLKKLEECNAGIELLDQPIKVNIKNLGRGVNSPEADYGPVINADESVMYITSRREGSTGNRYDPVDEKYYEDIYKLSGQRGFWSAPVNIGEPVNTSLHESVLALSADGQTMFIFRDDKDNPTDDGDIFISKLEGTKWSKPRRMEGEINSNYSERAVALSGDEQTLYIVSDRPSGYGGEDIYWSKRNADGTWSIPTNLGSTINTKYNERGIFFHPNGKTLYFSSQGHNTMGGYDIFYSQLDSAGNWSIPENIGYPINTPDDDVFFVLNANGQRGYYSSIREEGVGEKDIYVLNFEDATKQNLTILKGLIIDAKTKEPLYADIRLADNVANEIIGNFRSNSKTGKYIISLPSGKNYGISVKRDGYLPHSENFDIPESNGYQEVEKNIELVKLEVGSKVVLRNIFFDFDKAIVRQESRQELEILRDLLLQNPTLKVEISGHTDNKGAAEYNKSLSEARAKAVVDYLVFLGISSDRMTAKGYGAERAIAPNQNPDGSDNPEGRQLNRRTEFEVISK